MGDTCQGSAVASRKVSRAGRIKPRRSRIHIRSGEQSIDRAGAKGVVVAKEDIQEESCAARKEGPHPEDYLVRVVGWGKQCGSWNEWV